MMNSEPWPALPFDAWADTLATLQRWTQIAGKVKLQLSPFLNEWWHVALHLTARGLTTSTIPTPNGGVFQIDFDFIDHAAQILSSDGSVRTMQLQPRSVAGFYTELMDHLQSLGIDVVIDTIPDEVADRTPFEVDTEHASYDAESVERWWRVVLRVSRIFETYRSPFVGKSSPVNFWWGGFDLNQTRFSGRRAAPPSGANRMMRIAEDEENFSVGFWPGAASGSPLFYCYVYPEPPGLVSTFTPASPARYDEALREFVLPYDDARQAADPDATIMRFLQDTYAACATLAQWDRKNLERPVPGITKGGRGQRR